MTHFLVTLRKEKSGNPIIYLPISGPATEEAVGDTIEPVEQEFKVVAYMQMI